MFKVDPRVRVAPDEDGEEESGGRHRDQHQDQPEQGGVAGGHQSGVVGPGEKREREREARLVSRHDRVVFIPTRK